jgi:endoglucanase
MKRFFYCALVSLILTAVARSTPVEEHGLLQVKNGKIVDRRDEPVSLAGMSLFWSQWQSQFWNADCVAWLAQDWQVAIVRASMGVGGGGYLAHPEREQQRVEQIVDACLARGLYVIIDWHDHEAHEHTAQAVAFFEAMARKYGRQPNVIYEIYNEPLRVSWPKVVKPYSERVVAAIRAIDPDNLILVGSPHWAQDVDIAAADPLAGENLAYTLHFYAGTHKGALREKALRAMQRGAALFVSEWGTCNADGNGPVDEASVKAWMEFLRTHQLSHCNWAVSDKNETASIVVPGASGQGNWRGSELTPSGVVVRNLIRGWTK